MTPGPRNFVRKSAYYDSVTLMRVSRDLETLPGVRNVAVMMGTEANRALLREAGLLAAEGEAAGPADLVVAVSAETPDAAEAARAAVDGILQRARPPRSGAARSRPRTLVSAASALPGATLALVSVPGPYAGAEARKALEAGLHVMIFSDNVPLATEIELKRLGVERDLLVMGPDCGTAIVSGVPLGFANAVPRGRIGIVAASGTGLQEVACLVTASGEGISHALGVGGRDLGDEVGGVMMERALATLAEDPGTAVLCAIGKPPGPRVARRLSELGRRFGKPAVLHLTGSNTADTGVATGRLEGWHGAATLEDAAAAAVALARGVAPAAIEFTASASDITRLVAGAVERLSPAQKYVRGLYAGGTLAWEALSLLRLRLPDVPRVPGPEASGHRVVDLGDDAYTRGRPHPMLDGHVRREWIRREGQDASVAVLLLDVVLGYGAHGDPAGELVPAIVAAVETARADGRDLVVIASVCGTDADIQGRRRQIATLERAGVLVMPSNAQASRLAGLVASQSSGLQP
jgi:FdrA protein